MNGWYHWCPGYITEAKIGLCLAPQNVGATLTTGLSFPSLNVLNELVESLAPCAGINDPDALTGRGLMLIDRPGRITLSLAADIAGDPGTGPPRERTFSFPIIDPSAAAWSDRMPCRLARRPCMGDDVLGLSTFPFCAANNLSSDVAQEFTVPLTESWLDGGEGGLLPWSMSCRSTASRICSNVKGMDGILLSRRIEPMFSSINADIALTDLLFSCVAIALVSVGSVVALARSTALSLVGVG